MTGLCSHTSPDGKSYMGEQEKLNKKFKAGTITREELRSLAMIMCSNRGSHYRDFTVSGTIEFDRPKDDSSFETIRIEGHRMKFTVEEHRILKLMGFV